MNIYSLRATALCPVDGSRDHYDVVIRTDRQINVEQLREWFDGWATVTTYQEDLAEEARLAFGGEVEITGQHPSPVEVFVTS